MHGKCQRRNESQHSVQVVPDFRARACLRIEAGENGVAKAFRIGKQ